MVSIILCTVIIFEKNKIIKNNNNNNNNNNKKTTNIPDLFHMKLVFLSTGKFLSSLDNPLLYSRFMFWTDWGEQPKIERAEMDGSNREIIIWRDIQWPNGLTIDYSTGKIYWTDAKLFCITRANYDGSNRVQIVGAPMPSQCVLGHPFALTSYGNKIYWTDWKTRDFHSTNKKSGTRCQMVWSNAYSPMDIQAFEPRRQLPRPGKFNFNLIFFLYSFINHLYNQDTRTMNTGIFGTFFL